MHICFHDRPRSNLKCFSALINAQQEAAINRSLMLMCNVTVIRRGCSCLMKGEKNAASSGRKAMSLADVVIGVKR